VSHRRLSRSLSDIPLAALRPGWLSGAALRFGILCAFIAAVAMLSPRLSPREAGIVALVGLVCTAAGLVVLALFTRQLSRLEATRRPELARGQRGVDALLRLLRATGLPLLGLAFFLAWSLVYLGMYWADPARSFGGLARLPRYADFFYYSVTTALIAPPGDIFARSRGARAATMIEMLAGLALVTTYLSSFVTGRLGALGGQGGSEPGGTGTSDPPDAR
jgi:hypothetical protein